MISADFLKVGSGKDSWTSTDFRHMLWILKIIFRLFFIQIWKYGRYRTRSEDDLVQEICTFQRIFKVKNSQKCNLLKMSMISAVFLQVCSLKEYWPHTHFWYIFWILKSSSNFSFSDMKVSLWVKVLKSSCISENSNCREYKIRKQNFISSKTISITSVKEDSLTSMYQSQELLKLPLEM